jgi:hypothetical protein
MLVEPVLEMITLFNAQPSLRSRLPQNLMIDMVMQQVEVGRFLSTAPAYLI